MANALPAQVELLAAQAILVVVGTTGENGKVQLSPVWFQLADGHIWLNSNTRRSWPRNLQRVKQATLLLVDPQVRDRYAQIYGELAEVIPDPNHEFIDRLAQRYTGKPFRALEPGEERITLKIRPVRVTGQMI